MPLCHAGAGLLSSLPFELLSKCILPDHAGAAPTTLAHHPSANCSIRTVCHTLRRAYDHANTHLVLGGRSNGENGMPKADGSEAPVQQRQQLTTRLLTLLATSPSLTSLTLSPRLHWVSLEAVLQAGGPALCGRLQSLCLSHRNDLTNLQPLAACSALTHVDLSHACSLEDAQHLAALHQLQRLNLRACTYLLPRELRYLTGCLHLSTLSLSACVQLTAVQQLSELTSLTQLSLEGCHGLRSIQPLSTLTLLRRLDLTRCREVPDLEPLRPLTALQQLLMNAVSPGLCAPDLRALTTLSALTRLDARELYGLFGTCLQPLGACSLLCHLDLSRCAYLQCITPLGSLVALSWLDLSHSEHLSSLQSLSSCAQLRHIGLRCCHHLTLQLLASCTALQVLDLRGAYLISGLRHLEVLRTVQRVYLTAGSTLLPYLGSRIKARVQFKAPAAAGELELS